MGREGKSAVSRLCPAQRRSPDPPGDSVLGRFLLWTFP